MPLATDALYKDGAVSVQEAVRIRDEARRLGQSKPIFICVLCEKEVRAMRDGRNRITGRVHSAHFEHAERNPECPRSDVFEK
jgi:hypothetical protein